MYGSGAPSKTLVAGEVRESSLCRARHPSAHAERIYPCCRKRQTVTFVEAVAEVRILCACAGRRQRLASGSSHKDSGDLASQHRALWEL